jgi:hypothetical protein
VLTIEASNVTPIGDWYWTGDRLAVSFDEDELFTGSDDESEGSVHSSDYDSEVGDWINDRKEALLNGQAPAHLWRTSLNPSTFDPLMLAMARAVLRMPVLKRLELEIGKNIGHLTSLVVACLDAGVEMPDPPCRKERETEEQKATRRWKVWLGEETRQMWDVPKEVITLWREYVGSNGTISLGRWP